MGWSVAIPATCSDAATAAPSRLNSPERRKSRTASPSGRWLSFGTSLKPNWRRGAPKPRSKRRKRHQHVGGHAVVFHILARGGEHAGAGGADRRTIEQRERTR